MFGSSGDTVWSTRRKVILAVLPSSDLIRSGSCSPGSWTRIWSVPWRWIVGSRVPVSSTRRRTISIDCWMAFWVISLTLSSVIGGAHLAIGRDAELHALGHRFQDRAGLLDLVFVAERQLDRIAVDAEAGIADIDLAQLAADAVDDAGQPLAHHRIDIGGEQQMRAALEIEAEADPLMGKKTGDLVVDARGQQVGQSEDASQHQHRQYQRHLPSREIHHGK